MFREDLVASAELQQGMAPPTTMCTRGLRRRTFIAVEVGEVAQQLVLVAGQDVNDGLRLVGVRHEHLPAHANVGTVRCC